MMPRTANELSPSERSAPLAFSPAVKTYEQLPGADGRRMFYRAERFTAASLFRQAVPDLVLDAAPYRLQDLSLSGLGAAAAPGTNDLCEVGSRVPVKLGLRGIPLFEGLGEVARVEPAQRGTKLGLRLLDRCLDISQLVAKHQETLVRTELDELFVPEAVVSAEYRRLAADVLQLLRGTRAALARFEETKPDARAAAEMFAACEERVLPRWRTLWYQANALVAPIMGDKAALAATKRFTELVLTPELQGGAMWKRSYEKPLGYPGDFQIMDMVYDWQRVGGRLYDQFLHRLCLEVAECVATRMVMMRQTIAETVLKGGVLGGPARITSLGSGPAREVVDYLDLAHLPGHAQFTLIDQDHGALSQAYEQTYPKVLRHRGQANVTCLNASFIQIMKAGELFGKLPPQDLIYTVGLVDYFQPRRAKALLASLHSHLAPGGSVIIGNMHESAESTLWPMEFLCDWSVVYRTERDMAALADGLGAKSVATGVDPTGRVVFLKASKA